MNSASDLIETWNLVRDLRNCLAAAMRTIITQGTPEKFLAEVTADGVSKGIGNRSSDWLKRHLPKEE